MEFIAADTQKAFNSLFEMPVRNGVYGALRAVSARFQFSIWDAGMPEDKHEKARKKLFQFSIWDALTGYWKGPVAHA